MQAHRLEGRVLIDVLGSKGAWNHTSNGGGGQGGIRTLGTGLGYTRFPGVLIRPL